MVIEAEKSHSLPLVNWRMRKADGIIPSKPEALRTRVLLV